jgi:hypothetical protein
MINKKEVTGDKAYSYLRKQLNMGISLSEFVNKLPIENGKVYSFVPDGVSPESLYTFELGGIYPLNEEEKATGLSLVPNDARPVVMAEIQDFVTENELNCCLFEEPNASPDFPWVKSSGMEYVHLNNQEMFFFFDQSNCDNGKLKDAFITSEVYIFLCVLSKLEKNLHSRFAPFNEVKTDVLTLLVENTEGFFVRAYDGEGYLMWTPS